MHADEDRQQQEEAAAKYLGLSVRYSMACMILKKLVMSLRASESKLEVEVRDLQQRNGKLTSQVEKMQRGLDACGLQVKDFQKIAATSTENLHVFYLVHKELEQAFAKKVDEAQYLQTEKDRVTAEFKTLKLYQYDREKRAEAAELAMHRMQMDHQKEQAQTNSQLVYLENQVKR